MEKKELSLGWLAPLIIAALIPILFILLVASGDHGNPKKSSPYEAYLNCEWMPLSYYEASRGDYLGKVPETDLSVSILAGELYDLKGIPENDLLYCEQPTWTKTREIEILMNTWCKEPITRVPFKKIEITRQTNSIVTITDKDTLNKIQKATTEIIGTENIWRYGFKSKVYFDVECELIGYCDFGLDEEGRLIMTYYNNKTSLYCHCDVTDILMEEYQNY